MKAPRLTIRRLMVAVALAGVLFGVSSWLQRRADHFRRRSVDEGLRWAVLDTSSSASAPAQAEWHWKLSIKYHRAARYPWLPVAPDPPEPEGAP